MLRILIVDDQKSIRETLKTVLASQPDFKVVATADNGQTAIELAKKLLPDLMLVDLEMPKLDGLSLTRLIHRDFPSIKVIVLSIHQQDDYIQEALQAGAMGYLLKNTPAQDLREAVRFIDRGYTQFSPGLLNRLVLATATKSTSTYPVTTLGEPDHPNPPWTENRLKIVNPLPERPRTRQSWTSYLPYWLAGNAILWGLAILYLLFKSPTYTSQWSIGLANNQNSNAGSFTAQNSLIDPRQDYKFLSNQPEILDIAAAQVGIKPKQFGNPKIKIVENTSMMTISIDGNTPEVAQQKAIALQTILERKLQALRQGEIKPNNTTPLLRVVIQPNLPTKPTSPNFGLVGWLTLTSSVLLTIAIAYFWANSTGTVPATPVAQNEPNNYPRLVGKPE